MAHAPEAASSSASSVEQHAAPGSDALRTLPRRSRGRSSSFDADMLFLRRQQEAQQVQVAAPQHQKSYSADAIPDTVTASAEQPPQLARNHTGFSAAALGGNGSMPGSALGEIKVRCQTAKGPSQIHWCMRACHTASCLLHAVQDDEGLNATLGSEG